MKTLHLVVIASTFFMLFYFLIPITTIEFGCHSKEPKPNEATEGFTEMFTMFSYTGFLLNDKHVEIDNHIICTPE